MKRYLAVFLSMAAVIAAPMFLRPRASARTTDYARADQLTIISPHVETIRAELTEAFTSWMQEKHHRSVIIDWRVPGGTTEITRVINTEYAASLEEHWRATQSEPWKKEYATLYADAKSKSPAREVWLQSNVSSRLDLMLGGGPIEYDGLKRAGYAVAVDPTGKYGPAALRREHADWFTDAVLPAALSGQPLYDSDLCWVGTCLSAFGICYNAETHAARRLAMPQTWADLAAPHYENQIALTDPTKSGTVAAMFELIIQTTIRDTLNAAPGAADESAGIAEGWTRGLRLLRRIGANARYWTDSSNKIPLDVSEGEALAGMCVDFYGRNFVERLSVIHGDSRLHFHAPVGRTNISPQPMALLRGAPNPGLAHLFMEWMLSPEGQRIWALKAGTPGGPRQRALRNMPIRSDFYTPENLVNAADPELLPFAPGAAFQYEAKWTADLFSSLRVIVRAMCIDSHEELKHAWHALIVAGFPPQATALFDDVSTINYDVVRPRVASVLSTRDALRTAGLTRDLAEECRALYQEVTRLAAAGK